ncbi:MAG: hypothetical protein AAF490_20820 [Chloroflexota bacterium]
MSADFDSVFGDDDFNFEDDLGENSDAIEPIQEDDGFEDMFRQQAARSESSFDEIDADEDYIEEMEGNSGGGFSLGAFTPFQRLIIIALVLLDIVAIGFGVLILTGRFG